MYPSAAEDSVKGRSALLTDKAFEKTTPPDGETEIYTVYGREKNFTPCYSIRLDRKRYLSEFEELLAQFKKLCEKNSLKNSDKVDDFIDRLRNPRDLLNKDEPESFFAGIKKGFEEILYFLTKDPTFIGKENLQKDKLNQVLENLTGVCGAAVYNTIGGVRDELQNERENSLTSWLTQIRTDLVNQVVVDLISQEKLPQLNENIFIHAYTYFKNLLYRRDLTKNGPIWNIQSEIIPDGSLQNPAFNQDFKFSAEQDRLFFAGLDRRYEFNFILDTIIGKIRDQAGVALKNFPTAAQYSDLASAVISIIGQGGL